MHPSYMHPVTSKNQVHCTTLYGQNLDKASHAFKYSLLFCIADCACCCCCCWWLGVYAFVCKSESATTSDEDTEKELRALVRKHIGGFAVPNQILVSLQNPKEVKEVGGFCVWKKLKSCCLMCLLAITLSLLASLPTDCPRPSKSSRWKDHAAPASQHCRQQVYGHGRYLHSGRAVSGRRHHWRA